MGVRRFEIFTKQPHSDAALRDGIGEILGLASEQIQIAPQVLEGAAAGILVEHLGADQYAHSVSVVIYDATAAPNVRADLDIARPLAQLLRDEVACTPAGIPGTDPDDPANVGLWAVVDPEGVVRLGRERNEDDDLFELDIDPTPLEL